MADDDTRGLDLDAAENGAVERGLSAADISRLLEQHVNSLKGGTNMNGDSSWNGKPAIWTPSLRHSNTLMELEVKPALRSLVLLV